MLWYKGWLETRFRLLLLLGWFGVLGALSLRAPNIAPGNQFFGALSIFWFSIPVLLAGAGIKTQAALQATKGLHGSVHFTLALPVSRFRLLTVRATLGFLETIGIITLLCCGSWVALPSLRAQVLPSDALEYLVAVVGCVSAFYALGVLLAVFLDDIWQIWSSMLVVLCLRVFSSRIPPPANLFRALGESSPIFTHTLPWLSMSISFGIAVLLFIAAVKMVQVREY